VQGEEDTSFSSNVVQEQIEVRNGDMHQPFFEAVTSLSVDSAEEQVIDDDNIECPQQDKVTTSVSFNYPEPGSEDRQMRKQRFPFSFPSLKSW